jgi:hypothetical protein
MSPKEQWKLDPKCKAQEILEKLFEIGTITKDTKCKEAKNLDAEFEKFPYGVFYNNFSKLRALHGYHCTYMHLNIVFLA